MKYATLMFALMAFFLASCASTGPTPLTSDRVGAAIAKTARMTPKDATSKLKAAYDYAVANGDVVGAQCWAGLPPCVAQIQAFLNPPTPVAAPGVVAPDASGNPALAIEEFRVEKAAVDAKLKDLAARFAALQSSGQLGQIRQCINLACGALWVDLNASLLDPGGIFSGPAPK